MWFVWRNCLLPTDSFSFAGTFSFYAALSQHGEEVDGQKQATCWHVPVQLENPHWATINNDNIESLQWLISM